MMRWFNLLMAVAVLAACSSPGDEKGSGGSSSAGGSAGSSSSAGGGGSLAGPGCPDLSGVFACPMWQTDPAYTLTIITAFDGQMTTTYESHYAYADNTETTATYAVSPAGIHGDGFTGKCMPYMGVDAFAYIPDSPLDETTYNFINANDDLQADVSGAAAIVCKRSQ